MLTVISGGARSGKSTLAENLARMGSGPVTYVATAEGRDEEMSRRIRRHRQRRPAEWETLEEPLQLAEAVQKAKSPTVLVDCLSMWVSNRLLEYGCPAKAEMLIDELWSECRSACEHLAGENRRGIMVTNEVGCSVVPPGQLARTYRDLLGTLNQRAAARADRAVLMAMGIPQVLKGEALPVRIEVDCGG